MRKTVLRLVGSLIAIFSIVGMAAAQTSPLPGSGWYTTAQIQNVSTQTGDATVTLEVYPAEGVASTQVSSVTIAIPQGGGKTFFPGSNNSAGNVDVSPSLAGPFQGSMVVLAEREVVAVGQITNRLFSSFGVGVAGGYASEQYRGSEAKSATLIYPTVKNNFGGKTTVFSVQAAGANVTYTATIKSSDGKTYTKTGSISANKATLLIPSDFKDGSNAAMPSSSCEVGGVLDANTSPCFGAITVVATGGNIVGTVIEYKVGASPATTVQASTMFASTDAGKRVLCPTYKNAFPSNGNQRTTGITVANVSGNPVTFDLALVSTGGTTTNINNTTLQPGRSTTFFRHLDGGNSSLPATGTLAAATITSDDSTNSLVAVVSESNFPGQGIIPGSTPQKQTVYTCFNADQATNKVAAPIFKKDAGNNTTGLQIQNANDTGGASFSADVSFVCTQIGTTTPVNNYTLTTESIAPGGSANIFRPSAVPNGQLCSATITVPTGSRVIAVANESSDFFPGTDTYLLNTKNYEGFNLGTN